MAIIKATKGGKSLKQVMDYVADKAEIVSGKDCKDNKTEALKDMRETKALYNKLDGRQYKHYVQSFDPKDKITAKKAHQIGQEWANENFKNFEVFIATHTDQDHIHNHFIVNSVNFLDGNKIQISKKDLENMKLSNDRICEKERLSIPVKKLDNEFRSFKQSKYQLFKRMEVDNNVKSYIVDTAISIDTALKGSIDKSSFILNMNRLGYKTNWIDTRKNITFENKEGKKVRLSNLEKTFKDLAYTKEGLLNEFSKNQGRQEIRKKRNFRVKSFKSKNQSSFSIRKSKNRSPGTQRNSFELDR